MSADFPLTTRHGQYEFCLDIANDYGAVWIASDFSELPAFDLRELSILEYRNDVAFIYRTSNSDTPLFLTISKSLGCPLPIPFASIFANRQYRDQTRKFIRA